VGIPLSKIVLPECAETSENIPEERRFQELYFCCCFLHNTKYSGCVRRPTVLVYAAVEWFVSESVIPALPLHLSRSAKYIFFPHNVSQSCANCKTTPPPNRSVTTDHSVCVKMQRFWKRSTYHRLRLYTLFLVTLVAGEWQGIIRDL
jgi:hypothetical protein